MTLALMAVERYIFICHGIHYLRMINTHSVYISIGIIWLVSGAMSVHGGFVRSQIQCGQRPATSGLLCDAFTIKEHITLSRGEGMLVFVPTSVITAFCILSICYCYGCMYHAALKVSTTLKCNNHRANRTVGIYFLLFVLQLAPNLYFIILTVMGKRKASFCVTITSIVTPLLVIIPSCINATLHLIQNPQIRRLIFSSYRQRCRSTVEAEVEVFEQSRMIHGPGQRTCKVEQVERENMATSPPPLPGYVSSFVSEEC
ncbi:hypothetical protein ABVT39_016277 [Epinephelus coioides]